MRKILRGLAAFAIVAAGTVVVAAAQGDSSEPTHFPLQRPQELSWSFAGPFGTYDKAQLQRGLKVYKEVCSACHSLNLVAFRSLEDLGYSEAQVKAFAAEYQIHDGPNDEGEMFDRPRRARFSAASRASSSTSSPNTRRAGRTISMPSSPASVRSRLPA
jgi:ubiquinol-cytochrome c reductase cytochrome c1 subunit